MYVEWDNANRKYFVKARIGPQTFEMGFIEYYATETTEDFCVYLSVYNKRKHANDNEDKKKITGLQPFETYSLAIRAFALLEQTVLREWNSQYDVTIYCTWVDPRRRDAYYKLLSKRGYNYGRYGSQKAIMRKWRKGEYYSEV